MSSLFNSFYNNAKSQPSKSFLFIKSNQIKSNHNNTNNLINTHPKLLGFHHNFCADVCCIIEEVVKLGRWEHDYLCSSHICWDKHCSLRSLLRTLLCIEETTQQLWSLHTALASRRSFAWKNPFQFKKTHTFPWLDCKSLEALRGGTLFLVRIRWPRVHAHHNLQVFLFWYFPKRLKKKQQIEVLDWVLLFLEWMQFENICFCWEYWDPCASSGELLGESATRIWHCWLRR